MVKRQNRKLNQQYGTTDEGFAELPRQGNNVLIARALHTRDRGGCSFCFPHGIETPNAKCKKNRRSWKNHRPTQYHGMNR